MQHSKTAPQRMFLFARTIRIVKKMPPTTAQRHSFPLLVACCLILISNGDDGSAVHGLKLLQVSMPSLRLSGDSARLLCQYDLQGDALYSVKWYKGGREFYRYVPRDHPPIQVFPVEGVTVDKSQSDRYQVTLTHLSLASSGRYKCEVSVDAPSFQTSTSIVEMNVIHLPRTGPKITLRSRNNHADTMTFPWTTSRIHAAISAPSVGRGVSYGQLTSSAHLNKHQNSAKMFVPPTLADRRVGQHAQQFPNGSLYHYYYRPDESEVVELNCTSGRSKPAAALEWYVNGNKVQHGEDLVEYAPFDGSSSGEHDQEIDDNQPFSQLLETSVLGLRWRPPPSNAIVVLNCTSAVSSVYWSWTAIIFTPDPPDTLRSDDSIMYPVSSSGSQSRSVYQGTSQHRMLTSGVYPVSRMNLFFQSLIALSSSYITVFVTRLLAID